MEASLNPSPPCPCADGSPCLPRGSQPRRRARWPLPHSITTPLHHHRTTAPPHPPPHYTYPNRLYNQETLYHGFDRHHPATYLNTLDKIVYDYYKNSHAGLSIKDTLAQRLHDHSITDSLHEYISGFDERKLVAIMGGHKLKRTDAMYRQIAELSKSLTEKGYLMLSGGGPGAMEATHLGAWLTGRNDRDLLGSETLLKSSSISWTDDRL